MQPSRLQRDRQRGEGPEGQQVNAVRMKLEAFYNDKKEALAPIKKTSVNQDLSRTGEDITQGSHHPLSLVRNEIIEVFNRIGFDVSEGPEIEDDWHNFSALNFPYRDFHRSSLLRYFSY